ncbi:MAG: hypothetical protein U0840_25075 [Gemmataceae bacterium]
MSQEAQTSRPRNFSPFVLFGWIGLPLLILSGLYLFLVFGKGSPGDSSNPDSIPTQRDEENHLASVRSTLARQSDLATCRTAIQQLNAHLNTADEYRAQAPSASEAEKLSSSLGLQPDDLAEIASTVYTPLDAYYLDACFLLRDAMRARETGAIESASGKIAPSLLDRATRAFEWTVRMVRLTEPERVTLLPVPAPPAFCLRRGEGTPLERALVFLALLEQIGFDEDEPVAIQGSLVFVPDERGQQQLWCCGVATGKKPDALYLFDPALGLPLPGPGGKGIATLAQVRKDPTLLTQLKSGMLTYGISADQVKQASVGLVVPLSAVAPRMRVLQDRLLRDRSWNQQALPSPIRVRLAEDADASLKSIRAAVSDGVEVKIWKPGTTALRRFLPPEEGGSDRGVPFEIRRLRGFTTEDDPRVASMPIQRIYQLLGVPWESFPPAFRDPEQFRFDMGLGQQLRGIFAGPFMTRLTDPNSPRNLLLRGRYAPAVSELVNNYTMASAQRRRLQDAGDLRPGIISWVQRATTAFADSLRARGTANETAANQAFVDLFKWRVGDPIEVLMNGTIAGPRGAELLYDLALCRHDQALRHQARVDLAARAGTSVPGEAVQARKAWVAAEDYWREFLEGNPGRPGVAAARRLHAEALLRLDRKKEARQALENISAPADEKDKLGALLLAQQLGN